MLLADLVSKWLWFNGQNNLLASQLFNLIELVLITIFYLNFSSKRKSNLILPSAITVGLIMVSSAFLIYDLYEFNVIGSFVFKFFVIVFSLRELFLHKLEGRNRCYWINLGLLISAVVNIGTLSFLNVLTQYSYEAQTGIWIFNASIFILTLVFYGIEIMNEKKWKLTS